MEARRTRRRGGPCRGCHGDLMGRAFALSHPHREDNAACLPFYRCSYQPPRYQKLSAIKQTSMLARKFMRQTRFSSRAITRRRTTVCACLMLHSLSRIFRIIRQQCEYISVVSLILMPYMMSTIFQTFFRNVPNDRIMLQT